MKNICTVSDIKYLYQGLALFESLTKSEDITLHYLSIDQISYDILKNINNNKLIIYNIDDLLNNDDNLINLKNSDYRYFCWSLASYFSNYLLSKNVGDSITYIDSDIYFHEKIEHLFESFSNKDVGIFRHRQFNVNTPNIEGYFNVGVVYFKNSPKGLEVLNWWCDAVLFKKYPGLSTCGDQKYLDEFPKMCSNDEIFIDGNIGHGAPWLFQLYDYSQFIENNIIIYRGEKQKYIFTHFSQFEPNYENNTYIPSKMHHIYTPLTLYNKNKNLKKIYDDYFENLKVIKNKYLLQ
jgi:hypothetical protein